MSTRASRPCACVFAFLLIEISSRKAVPEVTSAFEFPALHIITKETLLPSSPLKHAVLLDTFSPVPVLQN